MTRRKKRDRRQWAKRLTAAYELQVQRKVQSPREALDWFARESGIPHRTVKSWWDCESPPRPWAWLLLEQMEYLNRLRMAGTGSEALLWRIQGMRGRFTADVGAFLNVLKEAEDELVREVGYSPAVESAREYARERIQGILERSTQ